MVFVGKLVPWDDITTVYHIRAQLPLREQEVSSLQLQEDFDDFESSLLAIFLLWDFLMLNEKVTK